MVSKDSVAWRLAPPGGEEGSLSAEQIMKLSTEHKFPVPDIEGLSAGLSIALDPERYLIRDESKEFLRDKAVEEVRALAKKLEEVEETINLIRTRLSVIVFKNINGPAWLPNPVDQHLNKLNATLENLGSFRKFLQIWAREKALSMREMPDKRKLRDERLRIVCWFIFNFWQDHGRALSYTTDPDKSSRGGPLVKFVGAVVACISDPSGHISGESVKSEIEYFKARASRNPPI